MRQVYQGWMCSALNIRILREFETVKPILKKGTPAHDFLH